MEPLKVVVESEKRSKFYCDISGHTLKKTLNGLLQNLENRIQDIVTHVSATSHHVIRYFFPPKTSFLFFFVYFLFHPIWPENLKKRTFDKQIGHFPFRVNFFHAKVMCFNQDCILSMLFTQCLADAAQKERCNFFSKRFFCFCLFDSCCANNSSGVIY